jgi:hypothetical protein
LITDLHNAKLRENVLENIFAVGSTDGRLFITVGACAKKKHAEGATYPELSSSWFKKSTKFLTLAISRFTGTI